MIGLLVGVVFGGIVGVVGAERDWSLWRTLVVTLFTAFPLALAAVAVLS